MAADSEIAVPFEGAVSYGAASLGSAQTLLANGLWATVLLMALLGVITSFGTGTPLGVVFCGMSVPSMVAAIVLGYVGRQGTNPDLYEEDVGTALAERWVQMSTVVLVLLFCMQLVGAGFGMLQMMALFAGAL